MDTLTHITIGACVGEAILTKKIGKKALLWGAIAQNLPDIDSVTSLWLSPAENLLVHRGITHSLVVAFLVPALLAGLIRRFYPQVSFLRLYGFGVLQLLLHDLLDLCNSYGTGILEPFSSERLTFNILYVIDPLFTISLVVASVALWRLRPEAPSRRVWVLMGLVPCGLYTLWTIEHKRRINEEIEASLASQHLPYSDYFTTPTPFNGLLWYAVTKSGAGYQLGYRSVWDRGQTAFHYVPKGEELLSSENVQVRNLKYFSRGFYTVSRNESVLQFNVLRFGQIRGWENPDAEFAFHFYLTPGYDNRLVMQRGRFTGWTWKSVQQMFRRIKGETGILEKY